jgi:hypothetical protein
MTQDANQAKTKTCNVCGQENPITDFRRRRRGSEKRHNQCRQCFAAYMRDFRRRRRFKTIGRFATQLKNESDLGRVVVLCNGMFQKFDGVAGFCRAWKEYIDWACQQRKILKGVIDSFLGIVNLTVICETNRQKPDYSALSAEELDSVVLEYVRRVLAE